MNSLARQRRERLTWFDCNIIIIITKKSAKKTILCKSEQKGKFLVSLITFIALSQIRVIDHEENHLSGNKIAFSKREVQVSEGSIY